MENHQFLCKLQMSSYFNGSIQKTNKCYQNIIIPLNYFLRFCTQNKVYLIFHTVRVKQRKNVYRQEKIPLVFIK